MLQSMGLQSQTRLSDRTEAKDSNSSSGSSALKRQKHGRKPLGTNITGIMGGQKTDRTKCHTDLQMNPWTWCPEILQRNFSQGDGGRQMREAETVEGREARSERTGGGAGWSVCSFVVCVMNEIQEAVRKPYPRRRRRLQFLHWII